MAKFTLQAGAEVDLLNKQEVRDVLSDWDAEQAARGRGVKALRFNGALGAITAGGIQTIPFSPASGYVWSLRNVGAFGSASGNWRFFVVTDTSNVLNPSGAGIIGFQGSATAAAQQWGSGQAWLYEGEYLAISNAQAQASCGYSLVVLEAPAELAWKLSI